MSGYKFYTLFKIAIECKFNQLNNTDLATFLIYSKKINKKQGYFK